MATKTLYATVGRTRKAIFSCDAKADKALIEAEKVNYLLECKRAGVGITPIFDVAIRKDEYDLPFNERHEKTQPREEEMEQYNKWKAKQAQGETGVNA